MSAKALESANLSLAKISGAGWQIDTLNITLNQLKQDTSSASIVINTLQLDALNRPLRKLKLKCAAFSMNTNIQCRQGRLYTALPIVNSLNINISYEFNGDFSLTLNNQNLDVTMIARQQRYQVQLRSQNLDLSELQSLLSYAGDWLQGWTFAGRGKLDLSWGSGELPTIDAHLSPFNYANDSGTQAAENLDADVQLTPADNYRFKLTLKRGDVYSDPVFISHNGTVIEFAGEMNWHDGFHLRDLSYQQPGLGRLEGALSLRDGAIQSAELRSDELDLRQLYHNYLLNYFNDKQWPTLALDGKANFHFSWGKQRALDMRLYNLSIANTQDDGFILNGINASIYWHNAAQSPAETVVSWRGAHIPPIIRVGPGSLQANLHDQHLRLSAPLNLPILDGALNIETLDVQHALSEQPAIRFAGKVQPISMLAVSSAFDLPELGGEISGKIPGIRYHDKRLQVDGALLLTVFGGTVVVHNLSLQNPLGDMPQLRGDIVLSELDLDLLTRFFSFGAISGHVSGHVSKLHMINWEPVAFDAFFHSSDHETAPRKISQKAINNLSSLGGAGVTQALSRSVLRVFNDFSYSKLGWGCHLQNGLCQMRGVESDDGGYYLVKGGHLPPRIDVRGFNQRVDWNDLLSRLKSITVMGAPTIE
jgi:hypothetical protein